MSNYSERNRTTWGYIAGLFVSDRDTGLLFELPGEVGPKGLFGNQNPYLFSESFGRIRITIGRRTPKLHLRASLEVARSENREQG